MSVRAFLARRVLLLAAVVPAQAILGAEPAPPPTPADVAAWSRLLDAAQPPQRSDGPLLARDLGQTAYAALVHDAPGLAEAALRKAFASAPELKAEEGDLYFAAAWSLYDDCGGVYGWFDHAPFILLYLDTAAKKGARRMPRMDDLVRVMRADLAAIEDTGGPEIPLQIAVGRWLLSSYVSPESFREILKEAESKTLGLARARHDQTVADMRSLAAALEAFGKEHGRLPEGSPEAIWAKLAPQRGRALQGFDAWGTRFRIEVSRDGRHSRIVSAGADRRFEVLPALDPAAKPEHRTTADAARDVVMQDGELVQEWREPLAEAPIPVEFFSSQGDVTLATSESVAAHRATMASMLRIYRACEAYRKDNVDRGLYPAGTLERIEASLVPKYLARFPRLDAWGTPFQVRSTDGGQIRIVSAGGGRLFEKLGLLSKAGPERREVGDPGRNIVLENGRFVQYWRAASPTACSPPFQVLSKAEAPSAAPSR